MFPPTEVTEEIPVDSPTVEIEVTDKEIEDALYDLLKQARDEDRFVRDTQLLQWKRLEYYWNNILDIFLDPASLDWRVPNWAELEEEGEVAPRLINIYRPHGESIVAALSVAIPSIIFHPDDADNPDDVEAAKAYRSITDLLALHNNASMLLIRAIVILFNQGTIFGYNYYHKDPKYGSLSSPRIEVKDIEVFEVHCPSCGAALDAGTVQGGMVPQGEESYSCQECGFQGPVERDITTEPIPQIVGFDKTPKGSIKQQLYSGLNVKIPAYVQDAESCGYLLLEFSQSVGLLRSIFKEVAKDINPKANDQTWESFSKLPLQYLGQMPDNAANVSCLWLRPFQFWNYDVEKIEIIKELEKRFPDGCYAIFINDTFMEAHSENMDEHWTISDNPLGSFIYAKALGENLATIQDLRASLVEIEMQTAEHGIPETFADGSVLDFTKYGEGRARPGMMTQVKPKPGKSIGDAFFSTKSAILSQEIDPLRQHLDQDAQFVVGDFPSVYGGVSTGGSKTASEYSKSQAAALQRLGTTWKIVNAFWAKFQSRSAVEYANVLKEMNQDVSFSKRADKDSYVNVWIRATSLSGRIGRVEPESSEQLPISWAQKKDVLSQLLTIPVPEILSVILHPRNSGVVKDIMGLPELYVPGEEDRLRQFKEFFIMSQGIPVPTNQLIDNAAVHIEVLRSILEGPQWDQLEENAKQACMMHLQEHMMVAAQQEEQASKDENSGSPSPEKKPKE